MRRSRRLASLAALALLAAAARGDEIPRPEHPQPQLQRAQWLNLNGTWEFWEGDACDEASARTREEFPDRITVPFCRESELSGLGRKGFVKNVLYRREITVPVDWIVGAGGERPGGRVLLHVGACDWRTVIWLNGQRVGFHEGGSAPITCELTSALNREPGARNELRVWAFDDTRSKLQQCGKQCDKDESYGCLYTRTTGIWQTVWLERVGTTYVRSLAIVPERANLRVTIVPDVVGPTRDVLLSATIVRSEDGSFPPSTKAAETQIATAWAGRSAALRATIPENSDWSPEAPRLFAVRVRLLDKAHAASGATPEAAAVDRPEGRVLDVVDSYFGVRDVAIDGVRVLLNGEPVFQRTILDQGFYPDGIWTAPSDAALKRDIELSMAAGFNGARLHQKVFEPRFHYWADRLGYLTWGEMPSWGNDNGNPATHRVVLQEWAEIVARDRNHPSIVGWCPFNETGARSGPLQNAVTALTRSIDPTRPLLDTSGYVHSDPLRDVDDAHDYDQDPVTFRARWWPNPLLASLPARYGAARSVRDRPFFVSEFGGIGWKAPGDPGWGYGNDPKTLDEWWARFQGLCDAQLDNPSLFGFCYTQLTDVEQERNGLYYYDRRPKFDVARLHAIVARKAAIEGETPAAATPVIRDWKVLVPAAVDAPEGTWSFATDAVAADAWKRGELGPQAREGKAGFGRKEGFDVVIGTPWTGPELFVARSFEWDGAPFERALLVLHHDEDATICVNGEELLVAKGWNDRYEPFDVTERARALLKKGANVIAARVTQSGGGQYFDVALLAAPGARHAASE